MRTIARRRLSLTDSASATFQTVEANSLIRTTYKGPVRVPEVVTSFRITVDRERLQRPNTVCLAFGSDSGSRGIREDGTLKYLASRRGRRVARPRTSSGQCAGRTAGAT